MIDKVENFTIKYDGKNLINKVSNLTINNIRNHSNGANTSDAQVQFAVNLAVISHQNLLSVRMIWIRHEEVPVLVPTMEPIIVTNNQSAMTVSIGVIQAPQALKKPVVQ